MKTFPKYPPHHGKNNTLDLIMRLIFVIVLFILIQIFTR